MALSAVRPPGDIEPACNSGPLSRAPARGSDNRWESDCQACVQAALALSSQRRVASSVQPGTAKRGAATPWLGTITCWRVRKCNVRCTVVALAEAHRVINRPKAKTARIAFAPIDLPPFLCEAQVAPPQSVAASRSFKLTAPWALMLRTSPPGPGCRSRPPER